MIAVWYDPDCDQIWITDEEQSFAPRSLVAYLAVEPGKVGIRLKTDHAGNILETAYGNLTDRAGFGFLSAVEAKAYLDGEFAKRRELPPTIRAGDGVPADDLGAAGDLFLDAVTGDLYQKEI